MTTKTVMTTPCPKCGVSSYLEVSPDKWEKWASGNYNVQDVFPDWSSDQRELLLTGMHPACWEEVFADVEE